MGRTGIVQLDGMRVGVIEETEQGCRFTYDATWLSRADALPISQRLPLEPRVHDWRGGLHPFFENLLPEGWLLELAVRKLKVPEQDAFGLLLATCRDCVGAVEIMPDPDGEPGS